MSTVSLRVNFPWRKEHPLNVHVGTPFGFVKHIKLRVAAMIHDKRFPVLIDDLGHGIDFIRNLCYI